MDAAHPRHLLGRTRRPLLLYQKPAATGGCNHGGCRISTEGNEVNEERLSLCFAYTCGFFVPFCVFCG